MLNRSPILQYGKILQSNVSPHPGNTNVTKMGSSWSPGACRSSFKFPGA